MKKALKVFTSSALVLSLLAGTGSFLGSSAISVSAAAVQNQAASNPNKVTVDGNYLYNDFIKLSVDESNGQFVVGTTGGNPDSETDNDKMLLYGFPDNIWSSYTTISVDGSQEKYHLLNMDQKPTYTEVAKQNTSTASYQHITVSQVLSFVRNVSTNRDDVLEIKYVLTNEDTKAHHVGVRIMLDTKLGDNDHAPFRVSGYGDVTTETQFEGSNIPQYWQAFDSLESPKVISQGSFLRDGDAVNNPDKVQFCNWSAIKNQEWDYKISEGDPNGDSAVGITWNEKALAPGESRSYSTYYGMSELTQNTEPPLSLSVYSDSIVTTKNVDQTTGDPVYNELTVTGYVQNIGDENTHNTYAKLVLPKNMYIVNGSAVQTIGSLESGKIRQVTWIVKVKGSVNPGEYKFKVLAGCDETTEKSVERKVTIPAILRNKSSVKKAHLTVGDSISITAASEGGYGSYLYAMYYKKTAASSWTKLRDYSTGTTASVKTAAAVPYQVLVKVKDENGSIADKIIDVNVYKKLSNKSEAPAAVDLGNKIVMKGAAAGGSGSYRYAYYYKRSTSSKWVTLKAYSTAAKADFKPQAAVDYDLKVVVKDTKTAKTAAKTLKVTVKDPLVNTSTISAAEILQGKSVTVNGAARGGKGGYQFAVFFRKENSKTWKTQQKLADNATVAVTFKEAGKYEICVHVQDAEGTLKKKFFSLTVNKPLINASTIDTKSLVAGETAHITAVGKDGAGAYTYSVYYKKSTASKWTTKQKNTANTAITFTPKYSGKYQVCVKVTDKNGATKKKTFTLSVADKLQNTSTLSESAITLGKKVTVNASATGGKGRYLFAVYYKHSTDQEWTLVQNYNSNKALELTPKKAGAYQVCVKVKDGRGSVVEKKKLDLTVKEVLKNTSTVTIGTKVTLKGSATGSTGTVNFAFYYKRSDAEKWTAKQNFSTNAKVTIAPKKGVSYDYCIKVKDASGKIEKKYFTIKIG